MDQYKFSPEHNQMIVDAIVDGYRDYIEHRKNRKSAFAWTKGNFIESNLLKSVLLTALHTKSPKQG